MRNRRVTLLDIGLDQSFDASMAFVQSTLQSINAGLPDPIVDIDFVRSRDLDTIFAAFTALCDVLHVMAHGDHGETPTFSSTDGKVTLSLEELGDYAADRGHGINASTVLADGCKTGIGAWQKALRDCLHGDIVYIGTSARVGWHEGTVFCSAFYGALFRNKGKGLTPAEQALDAADRAVKAYEALTDRTCPYKVMVLEPSRQARLAFR
jgi:hypothetical protein